MKLALLSSWTLILLLTGSQGYADSVKVAVAANFKLAAEELRIVFEKQTDHQLKIISASTGVLYNQIIHGAPYDVFLSADSERPILLENKGLGLPQSRITYAIGQLILVHRQGNGLASKDLALVIRQAGATIVIANPKTAPYGKAAQQTLLHLGIKLEELRLVTALSVALGYQMWITGNTEMALVSASLVDNEDAIAIPPHMHSDIKQQAIMLDTAKHNRAAWEFMKFLNTPSAQSVIVRHGYQLAETR